MRKFKIHIYADGANEKDMFLMNKNKLISGMTTNPSLMKKSGIKDYKKFAKKILKKIKRKPISFEVFADKFDEMEKQAYEINSWGKNVFVKIPITNSKGKSSKNLIKKLINKKIKLNITAIMTVSQIKHLMSLNFKSECILSIFCGRIADSGVDPKITIKNVKKLTKNKRNIKLLWASCRELYNIIEAEKIGCDIITVPNEILKKMKLFGKNLKSYSLETVKDFYKDAVSAGFKI
tara:strand:+ start:144 stop:848 length:705 start_codon:yes stop_codon:yes gene_type:complete